MRQLVSAGILFAIALGVACTREGGKSRDQVSSGGAPQSAPTTTLERSVHSTDLAVDLTAWLERRSDHLEIRYRVDNKRSRAIYVLNQIRSRAVDGAIDYRPDNVYTDIGGDSLQLTKAALLVRGVFPGVYDYPDALMVAPGASLSESFALPVPVRVRIPYSLKTKRGETRASRRATARRILLDVGVVPADAAGCTFVHEQPGYPEVVTVRGEIFEPDGGLLLQGQTVLSIGFELAEELPVLDYEDFPWH